MDTDQRTSAETLEQRVVRLLRDAHATAEEGDIEGALELAAVAYEDWTASNDSAWGRS